MRSDEQGYLFSVILILQSFADKSFSSIYSPFTSSQTPQLRELLLPLQNQRFQDYICVSQPSAQMPLECTSAEAL